MSLNYRDLRAALTEFDRIMFEARIEGWEDNPAAEKVALAAARRVLAEMDEFLADRVEELDTLYGPARADT